MATDEELLITNTLSDNWNITNAALPKFYYDDTIKMHDYRNYDAVKIYLVNVIEPPKGLGYTSYQKEVYITIDIRSNNRTRTLNDIDEIKRIIKANRKTLSGYDIFKMTNEKKVASYINYYQYIIDVYMIKYRTLI